MKDSTFTQINNTIMASQKLEANEKNIIATVLSWQNSGLKCTQSNESIAKKIGVSKSTVKRIINNLNKYNWFESKKITTINIYGSYVNAKEIKIDEDMMYEWLGQAEEKAHSEHVKTAKLTQLIEEPSQPAIETVENPESIIDEVVETPSIEIDENEIENVSYFSGQLYDEYAMDSDSIPTNTLVDYFQTLGVSDLNKYGFIMNEINEVKIRTKRQVKVAVNAN